MSLLHHTVFDNNLEIIDVLRQNLGYFNELINNDNNEEGWTPLSLAASTGNNELCAYFISQGGDIETKLKNG